MMSPRSKHSASCPIVADLLLADEELDLAGHVANVDEDELAGVALEDDAAGGADLGAVHLAGALFGEPGPEVDFRLRVIENGASRLGSDTSRPSARVNLISLARARISAMGEWSSKRVPHGSWPSCDDLLQLVAARGFPIGGVRRCREFSVIQSQRSSPIIEQEITEERRIERVCYLCLLLIQTPCVR